MSLPETVTILLHMFCFKDQNNYAKVVRVIIAGNSLSSCTRKKENESKVMNSSRDIKYF